MKLKILFPEQLGFFCNIRFSNYRIFLNYSSTLAISDANSKSHLVTLCLKCSY